MDEYVVDINGLPHTMQLSPEDADRLGARASRVDRTPEPKKASPANKSRSAANK